MPVDINCPHCAQTMRIADPVAADGKLARCPACSETFTVQIPAAGSPDPPAIPDPLGGGGTWRGPVGGPVGGPLGGVPGASRGDQATPPGVMWKLVIEQIRSAVDAQQLKNMGRAMANVGTYGMIGGIVLFTLYWIVAGFKMDPIQWTWVFTGLGGGAALTAVQFINQRLLTAIEGQINSAETRVSTTAVFDALGILFLLLSIALPITSFYMAFAYKAYYFIFVGIACMVVFGYLTLVSMNPEFLNIHPNKNATAADDALAVYAFGVKVFIAALPFLYGIFVVLGCAGLFIGMLQIAMEGRAIWVSAVHAGGLATFHLALILPLMGYITGIFGLLSVFMTQAVLVVPDKLSELIKIWRPSGGGGPLS